MFHLAGIAGSYAEQDLTRKTKSAAELVQKARAEKAARDEALAVIERWNGELASGTGAPCRDAVAGRVLSRLPNQPGDRYSDDRPASARVGRKLSAWLAMFVVSGRGTDADYMMRASIFNLNP